MKLHTEANVTGLIRAGELTQQSRQDGAGQSLLAGQIMACTVDKHYFPSRHKTKGNMSNTLIQLFKLPILIKYWYKICEIRTVVFQRLNFCCIKYNHILWQAVLVSIFMLLVLIF